MATCKICGSETQDAGQHKVLDKYQVKYFHCNQCDFIQTETPYWLDEAYASPINITDTGYVSRNIFLSKKILLLFLLLFNKNDSFLDYAGSYGLLTRLMRDYGLDFYWEDLYTKNIFALGSIYNSNKCQSIAAVTCLECFEHFDSPIEELEKILKISRNIFFSTRLIQTNKVPEPDWDYYGFDHGQHIAFYSTKTFHYIAAKYKLNYYTNGDNIHFLTDKKAGFLFKLALLLSKFQLDVLARKTLLSKTLSDSEELKEKQ